MDKKDISAKAASLKEYCSLNGRVCPLPDGWLELWNILPNKTRSGNAAWKPSLPLILAAWHDTSSVMKMLRLKEHIEWADASGVIDAVDAYLRNLDELSWHYISD